jgi:type IV fimbrial biogenesis protein FimT
MVHAMDHQTTPQRTRAGLPSRFPAGGGRSTGFTLVELVFTVTIAAILVSIGVPSFRYVTNANRVASEINGLLGDMQFARAEAVKEGNTVTICSSLDGATCSGATTWNTGWIVFMDGNGNKTVDANEPVLRVQAALPAGDTLGDGTTKAVTFNREGFALALPGTITLALHDVTANSAYTRCLAISIVGQLQTQKYGGACT